MRPLALALALLLSGCATPPRVPCEFPLWVRVTPDADGECRALAPAGWKADDGSFIHDNDEVLGCSTPDRIITNGTESNLGHEMKHQLERNCPWAGASFPARICRKAAIKKTQGEHK